MSVVATAEGFLRPSHEILLRMEALSGKSGNTGREMREEERREDKERWREGEKARRDGEEETRGLPRCIIVCINYPFCSLICYQTFH